MANPVSVEQGVARREAILEFVAQFSEARGHSPTVREIARGVGLASPGSAHVHLEALVEQGKLVRRSVTSGKSVFALPD